MIRTNLTMDFQHCTETGGKPKFISFLLIFFIVIVLDTLKFLQKVCIVAILEQKLQKNHMRKFAYKILPKNLNVWASINSKLNMKCNPYAIIIVFWNKQHF